MTVNYNKINDSIFFTLSLFTIIVFFSIYENGYVNNKSNNRKELALNFARVFAFVFFKANNIALRNRKRW